MEIGTTVTYIRNSKDGIKEGSAILKSIGLDAQNRKIVLLKDGDESFNAEYACINASDEFKELYKNQCAYIEELGKEGNAKAQAIIEEYNNKIDAERNELLGFPVEI